jgi:hypothetical protein
MEGVYDGWLDHRDLGARVVVCMGFTFSPQTQRNHTIAVWN